MVALQDPLTAEKRLKLELRLAQLTKNEECQENFLTYVRKLWPEFIAGRHHLIIAEKLERVARGELKRLIINMAPRHTKSEFASFLFSSFSFTIRHLPRSNYNTYTTAWLFQLHRIQLFRMSW